MFLIGGRPGAITEAEVMKLFDEKKDDDAWILWNNATRNCTEICRGLLRDLSEWAGEPERMTVDDNVHAILRKQKNGENYLVYIYNPAPAREVSLRVTLPAGKRWKATALTLAGEKSLGTFDSAEVANPGIPLPLLEQDRFLGIRLEPVGWFGF